MGVVEYAPRGRLGLGAQAGLGRIHSASTSDAVRLESAGLGASGAPYGVAAGPRFVLAPYGAYLVQLRHRVTVNGRAYPELYLRTRLIHGGLRVAWRWRGVRPRYHPHGVSGFVRQATWTDGQTRCGCWTGCGRSS